MNKLRLINGTKYASIETQAYLKGTAQSKNGNLHFLAPAQRMHPIILVSYEAPFRINLQKSKKNKTLSIMFLIASYDTKIGCIQFILAGAQKYKILIFAMRSAVPFNTLYHQFFRH